MRPDFRIERMSCWLLKRTFEMLWCRRWCISRKNCYGRWIWIHHHQLETKQQIREGTIYTHQNRKIPHTAFCGKGYAYCLLGWTRGNFGALHALGEHCDHCNISNSKKLLHFAIKSKLRGRLSTGVLFQHDNFRPRTAHWTVTTIQCLSFGHVQHPLYSAVLPSSEFHILGPLHSAIRTSLWGVMKRCSRQCTSGCALNQRNFYLQVYMHFRSPGSLVWNGM